MELRFLCIDPGTNGDECPAVLLDEETGDLVVVVKTVTDPAELAKVAKHTPIGDDESVGRLPARMKAVILEALKESEREGPHIR